MENNNPDHPSLNPRIIKVRPAALGSLAARYRPLNNIRGVLLSAGFYNGRGGRKPSVDSQVLSGALLPALGSSGLWAPQPLPSWTPPVIEVWVSQQPLQGICVRFLYNSTKLSYPSNRRSNNGFAQLGKAVCYNFLYNVAGRDEEGAL